MKYALAFLLTTPFFGWTTAMIYNTVRFSRDCKGYLKRAADANTVEMAKDELEKAISYIENNGLTTGSTGVVIFYPRDDVAFWYKNLRESHLELCKVTSMTSQLEKSNLLLKLRQTLLDKTQDGESVTLPNGISVHPYNTFYSIWLFVSLFLLFVAIAFSFVDLKLLHMFLD